MLIDLKNNIYLLILCVKYYDKKINKNTKNNKIFM